MEQFTEHLAHYSTDNRNFELVSKSDFWMQPMQISAPKPTQHYHYHDSYELYYLYSGERYYFIKDKVKVYVDGKPFGGVATTIVDLT